MRNYFIISILLLFAGAAMLSAQKETPPPGGTPKDFNLPSRFSIELNNGMAVTLVPYGSLPKVTIQFRLKSGNIDETPDQVWLADLTADFLKEGTNTRSAKQLAEDAAAIGGELNVSVSQDQTTIGGEALGEFAPVLVELLSDVLRNPAFPEKELERYKKNYLRQLSLQQNKPDQMALEKFRKVLYPAHPYGRLFPTETMIHSYRMADIREFYQKNYGAARTHLYIVGVFDRDEVIDAVRKYLSDWRAGEPPLKNPPASGSTRAVYLVDRPDAVQSTILIGQPVIDPADPDYIPMQVTHYLIGGFFSSRVIRNIREDKGWAYSPYSSLSTRYHDAYWVQQADVSPGVTGAAIGEIFHEIDSLRKEPPPEEELNGIKNYMTGVFVLQNSSRTGIINQLAFADLQGLGEAYLTGYVKNVFAVTPEDITRIVNTYLPDDKFTIVIAGDVAKIKNEVRPFGK